MGERQYYGFDSRRVITKTTWEIVCTPADATVEIPPRRSVDGHEAIVVNPREGGLVTQWVMSEYFSRLVSILNLVAPL